MKKTPLYETHIALGAKMIDFGGWSMPVQYTSVIEEHQATRRSAGLFDICHMGEFAVKGPQAFDLLQFALSRNLLNQENGQIKLSVLLKDDGGIIDDLTVYKLQHNSYMLVTNAATRDRDWQWITALQKDRGLDCTLEDISDQTGKIDLQGPQAQQILQALTPYDLSSLHYYNFTEAPLSDQQAIISRSGYTGEDGFEIYAPATSISHLWEKLLQQGQACGLRPAGLGARDTLRLEAGMLLNGQDMTGNITPLEVPYSWLINFDKDFMGAEALKELQQTGIKRKLVGLEMIGRGIARHGYKVFHDDQEIGIVTSGTFAPTLNKAIGLALIDVAYSAPQTEISVAVRNVMCPAQVVKIPFYKRQRLSEVSKN